MTREPGTVCRLTYDCGTVGPDEGDFVRTPAGSCYRVLEARRSPSRPGRWNLRVERLERNAVQFGAPGVWPLHWHAR